MSIIKHIRPLLTACLLFPSVLLAQTTTTGVTDSLTLEQCVDFALENRAAVEQALIDEQIGEREIKSNLSGWFPQLSARYGGNHNVKLQQQPFGDQIVTLGQKYTSNMALEATQTIFSSELLLATKAARFTRQQLDQQTTDIRINTIVDVSKAFYAVLLTYEQLRILDLSLTRQEKQYNDARSRYEVGLVDKTDYQRAAITLANIRSDRKRTAGEIKSRTAFLKQLMGYPAEQELGLAYDYSRMEQAVLIDTTQTMVYENRIEVQQLQTQQELLFLNTAYNRWGYYPTVSAYGNYNLLYFNNEASDLYNTTYPTSAVGLEISLPIFQGMRRLQNVKIAKLQEDRLEVEIENTRSELNTEYQTALANYKSDYTEWRNIQDNLGMAEEVYDIIKLQYDEGVKAYVDLLVAEIELRSTQLLYYNALYNLLASKLDLQRALGDIDINR